MPARFYWLGFRMALRAFVSLSDNSWNAPVVAVTVPRRNDTSSMSDMATYRQLTQSRGHLARSHTSDYYQVREDCGHESLWNTRPI